MALPARSVRPATAPLPKRPLGRTDMSITPIGFGAWAIGGPDWAVGWGNQDDATSIAAIRHAVALGVNWIDTAAVYGLGHSEEIVREALKHLPADRLPYVFTKGGLVWDDTDRKALPRRVSDPVSLRRGSVERCDKLDFVRRLEAAEAVCPPLLGFGRPPAA